MTYATFRGWPSYGPTEGLGSTVVVVDGSDDASSEILDAVELPVAQQATLEDGEEQLHLVQPSENLGYLESELLDYSAGIAPMPRSKKEKPSVSPADLADRLSRLMALRAKAGLCNRFGGVGAAKDVLERLVELLTELEDSAPDVMAEEMKRSGPGAKRQRKASR